MYTKHNTVLKDPILYVIPYSYHARKKVTDIIFKYCWIAFKNDVTYMAKRDGSDLKIMQIVNEYAYCLLMINELEKIKAKIKRTL